MLGLASEMPNYSTRRALLWQLIAKKERDDSHYIQLWGQCVRDDSYCSKWHAFVGEQQRSSSLGQLSWCQQWLSIARHSPVAKLSLYSACSPGEEAGNSVRQIGEYVFLWRLPSPSHQLFFNLHDLWIKFSACLERRLLKRRTTVALSDLASRAYARVESINLSRA